LNSGVFRALNRDALNVFGRVLHGRPHLVGPVREIRNIGGRERRPEKIHGFQGISQSRELSDVSPRGAPIFLRLMVRDEDRETARRRMGIRMRRELQVMLWIPRAEGEFLRRRRHCFFDQLLRNSRDLLGMIDGRTSIVQQFQDGSTLDLDTDFSQTSNALFMNQVFFPLIQKMHFCSCHLNPFRARLLRVALLAFS
jgi:hypothetical protein